MKLNFTVLGFWVCSFVVLADPAAPPPKSEPDVQIYTQQSAEQVEALNKAAEVLRDPSKAFSFGDKKEATHDPTQMSPNFRSQLNKITSATGAAANAQNPVNPIPLIELAAKIMGKNKSVILRIKDKVFQVMERESLSLQENQQIITLRVEQIDAAQVRISVVTTNPEKAYPLILQ